MKKNELVRQYIDAWNQQDVTALLDLMHAGAAYYDAFWMETCVGYNLAQYFRDSMDEEPFWYKQVGETLRTTNCLVFRYSAHDCTNSKIGEPLRFGAEILNILNGKILTITDMYCSADPSDLLAVADLAAKRHGLTSHTGDGLGGLKAARIKENLSASIEKDRVYLDPDITIFQLAENIGCTLDQLSLVIENQFGSSTEEFLDVRRVEHAKELLKSDSNPLGALEQVASSAGFNSIREFRVRFTDIVGVTPMVYYRKRKQRKRSHRDLQPR